MELQASATEPRRRFRACIRALFGLALLILLLSWVNLREFWSVLQRVSVPTLAAGFLLSLGLDLLSSVKLHALTRDHAPDMGLPETVRLYLVSGFFNNFLPTNIGGDAVKVGALARRGGSLASAGTAVALERASGLGAVWAMAWTIALLAPRVLSDFGMVWLRWPVIAGSGIALLALLAAYTWMAGPIGLWLRRRRRARPSCFLWRVWQNLRAYGERPALMTSVMAISFTFHVLRASLFMLLVASVGQSVSLAPMLWAVVVVSVVSSVPISLGALGLREGAIAFCLTMVGISPAEAVAVALLARLLTFAKGTVGGILYALGPGFARSQRTLAGESS